MHIIQTDSMLLIAHRILTSYNNGLIFQRGISKFLYKIVVNKYVKLTSSIWLISESEFGNTN